MKTVVVGLSGGVDSSVAAYLLKQQGFHVIGLFMKNWHDDSVTISDECPWLEDSNDAMLVAETLEIPFQTVDLSEEYKTRIVDYMFDEYQRGRTPNPDILCNREIKFDVFLKIALSLGADFVATGHYCRKTVSNPDSKSTLYSLRSGADSNKDQSYFLARLTMDQLRFARFPLGEIAKSEVREKARNLGLTVAEKKDSQGICFLGKVRVPEFLSSFIDDQPGDIVTVEGKKVGHHKGLHRYTLGQRRGIGVPSNTDHKNYVVTGKDQESNRLIVAFENAKESTLWAKTYEVSDLSFLSEVDLTEPISLLAKARYRDPSTPILLHPIDEKTARITFSESQRALTPGQILALYKGEQMIGSGIYLYEVSIDLFSGSTVLMGNF